MERVLRVRFFQRLKCLFSVAKRDVDRRYFIGRHVLFLPKLIQLIDHSIRLMLVLRLRICTTERAALIKGLPPDREIAFLNSLVAAQTPFSTPSQNNR